MKTVLTVIALLTGLSVGGFSLGSIGLGSKDIPTNETVQAATGQLVDELRLIRRDIRELELLKFSVEENSRLIESVIAEVDTSKVNQQRGFSVLWEQNKLFLEQLSDIKEQLEER